MRAEVATDRGDVEEALELAVEDLGEVETETERFVVEDRGDGGWVDEAVRGEEEVEEVKVEEA